MKHESTDEFRGNVRSTPAEVVIIDDHPLIREGIAGALGDWNDFRLCGSAAGVYDGLQLVVDRQPDIAIVDIGLQDGDGLDLTRRIRSRSPRSRVLLTSVLNETIYAEQALAAGANGFISKSSGLEELRDALQCVLRGGTYLSKEMQERLRGPVDRYNEGQSDPISRLSMRELQVFKLIGEGKSTAAIAEHLNISVKTVETHRAHIKGKLNLSSPHELKERAIRWFIEAT
jgi:DNA-binding NarL/FixJ family response regulator